MDYADTLLRRTSTGGRRVAGSISRRRWAAIVTAIAALVPLSAFLSACESPPRQTVRDPAEARRVMEDIESGLDLYDDGDFVLAAQRFSSAAEGARRCEDPVMERKTTTAECTSWLRAGRMEAFGACTARLEALHRVGRRSDPGLNTLLSMGAVAGGRPLPPLRVPSAVHPMVRAAAQE